MITITKGSLELKTHTFNKPSQIEKFSKTNFVDSIK